MTETASDTISRPGALPAEADQLQAARDRPLTSAAAVALARRALAEITAEASVGDHVASACEGERLVTHLFDCSMPGYRGWRWAVTLSRTPRSRTATVCEMSLLPGEEALLAPAWVPWADRLRPEDLVRPDRSPARRGDEHPGAGTGAEVTGTDQGGLALGGLAPRRQRVRRAVGVALAAQRWYDSLRGRGDRTDRLGTPGAACSSSGFSLPLTGALRAVLGTSVGSWGAGAEVVSGARHGSGGTGGTGSAEPAQADGCQGSPGGRGHQDDLGDGSGGWDDRDRQAVPSEASASDGTQARGGGALSGQPGAEPGAGAESGTAATAAARTPEGRAASARAAVIGLEARRETGKEAGKSPGAPAPAPGTAGARGDGEGPGDLGGHRGGRAVVPRAPRTLGELEAALPRH